MPSLNNLLNPGFSEAKSQISRPFAFSKAKGLFGCFFLSLNFRYSSLITLKYHTRSAPSLTCHHSIFFTLFVGPMLDTLIAPNNSLCLSFFFSFFFPSSFYASHELFSAFRLEIHPYFSPSSLGFKKNKYICSLSCIDRWTGFETTCSLTVVDGFPWWLLIGGFGGAMGLWCCW